MADYDWLSASNGSGDAALMHVNGSGRLTGATTIPVDTVANVPDKFMGTYGVLGADGLITPASARNFKGHVSSGSLVIDGFLPGSTDNGNSVGDVVIVKPQTHWANTVASFIKNITGLGTPEAVTVDGITVTTSASFPAGVIQNSNIATGAVKNDKLGIKTYGGTLSGTTIANTPVTVATISIASGDVPGSGNYHLVITANGRIQNSGTNWVKDFGISFSVDGGTPVPFNYDTATSGRWFVSVGNSADLTLSAATAHTVTVVASFADVNGATVNGTFSAFLVKAIS